jgi:iron complex outermembrane receptor protein
MKSRPGWEIYSFASYGHRNAVSAANWRQQSAATNRDFSVLTPATVPNSANFVPLTPIGFLPLIETDLDDYAATLGVRGRRGGMERGTSRPVLATTASIMKSTIR